MLMAEFKWIIKIQKCKKQIFSYVAERSRGLNSRSEAGCGSDQRVL